MSTPRALPSARTASSRSSNRRLTMVHAFLIAIALMLIPALARATQSNAASPIARSEMTVSTPIFPNSTCPIMGKPVSTRLFADTPSGRIYVCCKSCVKDILDDVPIAYRTAYPTDKRIENKLCPISGMEITKDSPTVVLQGFSFLVRGAGDVARARENSQIVLARLNDPTLVDLENTICPVSGEPVARNAFVVIDGTIVRLSSAKLVDEIAKDPAKVLKRAREIRGEEDAHRESAKPRIAAKQP